jgi:CO/xanthine dehydrogenase FAD-binding subunit
MITEYHRPLTLDEAIVLADRSDTTIIAGGTTVNSSTDRRPVVAVDLQALDLSWINAENGSIRVGATTRLQDIVDSDLVPDVLRDLSQREAPNTIRNAATIGGTVGATQQGSQFLAGLLAFGASASIARSGSVATHGIEEVLGDPGLLNGAIITDITVPASGIAAADRTGRTPRDLPIVMAVAHRDESGTVRLAMTGVGPTPLIVDPEHLEDLDPPGDFRGSSAYRSHLAMVLAGRVIAEVSGGVSA